MTIRTVAETGSTNADMLRLAAQGAEEGLWLRAERQTAGRGRQGRVWTAPPGNLSASTLVRLRPGDPPAPSLALLAGVALCQIAGLFLSPDVAIRLKWPNDVLVNGAKMSGILLERGGDAVVVGIGVNVLHHPDLPDRPTTSLAAHGATVAPDVLLEVLAEAFARWLARWRDGGRGEGLGAVRAAWLAAAHPVGSALRVHQSDGSMVEGLFDGLDGEGALIVRLASGERRVIHAGDIVLA